MSTSDGRPAWPGARSRSPGRRSGRRSSTWPGGWARRGWISPTRTRWTTSSGPGSGRWPGRCISRPARRAARRRGNGAAGARSWVPEPLRLTWIGHATVLLELGGVRFLTDPFLRYRLGPLRRRGPSVDRAAIGRVDAVLLSHAHPDHFDRRSLAGLDGDPLIIVPTGLGKVVRRMGLRARELAADERTEVGDVGVTAVSARH